MTVFDSTFRSRCDVRPVSSKEGKEFIRTHHYSHGSHNGPTCFGLYVDDCLVGVCAFATPCSENVRASVFGPDRKDAVTELHRLVLLDEVPKNAESWFIVRALRLLKKKKPQIEAVLSFADATENHVGTIYQATNAIYTGRSGKARFYVDKDGRLRHPRQNGVNVSLDEALSMGWRPTMREGKHRYLYLLPATRADRKRLLRTVQLQSLPYPKITS